MPCAQALLALLGAGAVIAGCGSTPACPPGVAPIGAATPAPDAGPTAPETIAPTSMDDMAKSSALLDRFHAAAAAADEEMYFACFAEGGVFLGTDATERWTVPQFRAYAHPRFASGKAWSFKATRRNISGRGDTAWFDEDLDTPNLGPARGSGVLARDAKGEWKVAQYNLSVPIPNERFADVRRVIAGAPAPPATPPAAPAKKPTPPRVP